MDYLESLKEQAKKDGYTLRAVFKPLPGFRAIDHDVAQAVMMQLKPVIEAVKHEKHKPQDQPDNAVPVNLNGHRMP